LLTGRAIATAGAPPAAIAEALAALGARVERLDPGLDDGGAEEWVLGRGALHALIYDARGAFANGGGPGALRDALDQAWIAVRAVATGALIPAGDGGKLLLVGPSPAAGVHADAARAGLENLARTLSVEWARYRITAVAIAPGPGTGDEQLAELLAYLVSPAGDYFTGCRIELGAISGHS
jgi:hypothetical protein